jgi:hypothetical protein
MIDKFRNHIEKFTDINDEEFLGVSAFFHGSESEKERELPVQGKVCKYNICV